MKDIIKLFREAGKETVIVVAIGAVAAGYFIHEGVNPVLAVGLTVAAVTAVTIDYLRKAGKHDGPTRPVVHSEEIQELERNRERLRKELGIGQPRPK